MLSRTGFWGKGACKVLVRLQEAKSAVSLLIVVALWAQSTTSLAFVAPLGGLSSAKRLQDDADTSGGETYNLSYAPVLLHLAKVMGRLQMPAGFYLHNEPLPNHPGIDLRMLLLQQSGPLELPPNLRGPDKLRIPQGSNPSIGVRPLPQGPAKKLPADQEIPKLNTDPIVTDSRPVQPITRESPPVPSPDEIRLDIEQGKLDSSPEPKVSVDFPRLALALTPATLARHQGPPLPVITSSLTTTLALNPAAQSFPVGFLLWTQRPDTTSGELLEQLAESIQPSERFQGSIVACRSGVRFLFVRNRCLGLKAGRLLAKNSGGELVIDTASGSVEVQPGAAAIVECDTGGNLRVMALKSSASMAVLIRLKAEGQEEIQLRVPQSEEVMLSTAANNEFPDDGIPREKISAKGQITTSRFDLRQVLEKEPLLNPQTGNLTKLQKSALTALRDHLRE